MTEFLRRSSLIVPVVMLASLVSHPAESAPQPRPVPAEQVRPALPPPAAVVAPRGGGFEEMPANADQTRRALRKVLSYYSPNVGRVLALDPLLVQNAPYMEAYPDLAAFLRQHPEVGRNAAYYLGEFRYDYFGPPDKDTQTMRMWSGFFAGLALFLAFAGVTGVLVWLVKTLVDYRRWIRLSKVQTEAHNKLLDRFTANEDLLAYIGTPSGKRFLESAPIMLDPSSSVGSPLRRILWSVEAGIVLASVAGGVLLARYYVPAELQQVLTVVGIFAVSFGVGFILAALASYLISRRLGVIGQAGSGSGRVDAQPSA